MEQQAEQSGSVPDFVKEANEENGNEEVENNQEEEKEEDNNEEESEKEKADVDKDAEEQAESVQQEQDESTQQGHSLSNLHDGPTMSPSERVKYTLIEQLEKKHTCPQCNEVMRYPLQFKECSHKVCSPCFHEFLKVEPRCPVDQGHIKRDDAFLDEVLTQEIMALEIKCNNHEWECKWVGKLLNGQAHLGTCNFTDILCTYDCGAKFQRRFLQKHIDKDCPKKIIACAFCDERCLREEKKAHLEECQKVPLPCPNKCAHKFTVTRDALDHHIETECPRTKILCQFEEIGCPHRCCREKLVKHNKTGIINHVRLLYDVIMKQGQRLDQHHELLQDHTATLSAHQIMISNMENVARTQLVWRIDEFSRKMKEAKSGNTTTLFSPPFQTSRHGYRLCASVCLNGDGKGKGTHMSVFVSILKGAYDQLLKWPFNFRISFHLLDQNSNISERKHVKFSIKPNPCSDNEPFLGCPKLEKNASFGGAKFCSQELIENSPNYSKDDVIYLKISCDCDGSSEG